MPRDKDLKRLVRTRMGKTGESYTAARAHIVRNTPEQPSAIEAEEAPAPDYAALAGMSDEAVAARTGCGWERWAYALDAHGAAAMSHREIAALVREKYDVGDWWAQAVTVGYERIRGLRERGQRRGGAFETSKSRTFNVPVAVLFDAWADPAQRRRWLTDVEPDVRTATRPRTMRLTWPDGTRVGLWFMEKSPAKSTVTVQHEKLADRDTADRMKQYWSERLDALGALLKAQSE